jgi:putative ABC transport system permease protein
MTLLRAFRLLILRDLLAQRVRTTTTIAGIALGIGVLVAIQLAAAAAQRGFEHGVENLAGRAALEITQAPMGIDERNLPRLAWLQELGQVTPIVEGTAVFTAADGMSQVLTVFGIDILTDAAFRDYAFAAFADRAPAEADAATAVGAAAATAAGAPPSEPTASASAPARSAAVAPSAAAAAPGERSSRDILSLLGDIDGVVLTETFAREHGIKAGGTITLSTADGQRAFRVRGLLAAKGPAQAAGGNLVLMDIAAAQVALGRLGYVDRLEIRPDDGANLDEIEATIARRLGERPSKTEKAPLLGGGGQWGDGEVRRPERRGREVEQMQAAFRSNLTALSAIALIAGMFLVYNTVSASVLTRRQEIGMLRAVGTSRSTVFALFLGEALCLAAPGCALGLVVGRLLAQGAVTLTSRTVSRMYVSAAAAAPSLDAWHITLAFLVGIPLALIAAAAPAHEASRVPPTDAIRRASHVAPASRLMRSIVAVVSFALAAWLCTFDAIGGLPLAGYLACFCIVIGVTALTAPLLLAAAHVVRWAVHAISRRVFFVAPWLATNNLVEYARRMSVSVAALAVSLAMTVAIAVMVSSFRETVIYWVGQTLVADLYIGPAARRGGSAPGIVPAEIEAIVRAHPRVTAVDTFRVIDIPYQHARIFVGAGNFEALLSRNRLLFKAPSRPLDAVRAALGQDAAIVSEAFALRYRKNVGDEVILPVTSVGTSAGTNGSNTRAFRIAAIYYDYSNDRGTVMLDRPVFARHIGDARPAGLNVHLDAKTDDEVEAVRRDLLREIGAREGTRHGITVTTSRALRSEVLRIFDGTFAITWALEVVAIAVAVMGIVATLITVIDERRRELAVLRLAGASRGQVQRMIVAEAAILGAIGQALGLIAGLALSIVLVDVINVQSFGWSIQFHAPILFLLQLTMVLIVVTALAGVIPARRAARTFLTEQTGDA